MAQTPTGTVYLLHFDKPLGDPQNPRGQAWHYLGWTKNLAARLALHRKGRSHAKIMRAVFEAGITFRLVKTWPGDPKLEKKIKRQHNHPRHCHICRLARLDPQHYGQFMTA